MNKKINNFKQLIHLSNRHFLVFMKDKLALFFSLLGPLVVILVFLLFLKNIQVDATLGYLRKIGLYGNGANLKKEITKLVLNDMFGGVVTTSIITVSFATCSKIVDDKISGISRLYMASPIKNSVLTGSYILATFFTSFMINLIVYFISMIVLAATGAFYMTVTDVFINIALIFFGVLSASTIFIVIVERLTKATQVSTLGAIIGATSGFFLGAYVPLSQLGNFIRKAVLLSPGTYTVNVLKEGYLRRAVDEVAKKIGDTHGVIREIFDWKLKYFNDKEVPIYASFLVLILSSIIFFIAYILIKKFAGRTNRKNTKDKKVQTK